MRRASTPYAFCAMFVLINAPVLCCAQAAPSDSVQAVGNAAGFEQTIRAATETLDAISRLITANRSRHQVEADADPTRILFADVARTDRAYGELTTLQDHNVVIGYPSGFFSGRRVLVRYEFAVAIHRILQNSSVVQEPQSEGQAPSVGLASRADTLIVSKLVDQFGSELRALGVNVREVRKRLDARLGGKGQDAPK